MPFGLPSAVFRAVSRATWLASHPYLDGNGPSRGLGTCSRVLYIGSHVG